MLLAVILALLATALASAETPLQRAKFENLGLFAGYVVACGVASETEAEAMVQKLRAGLGEPTEAEAALLRRSREDASKGPCPDALRSAVTRGWLNYRDAQ
jgi:hypothetical protein